MHEKFRKDLKTTGISKRCTIPTHIFMDAAKVMHKHIPRTKRNKKCIRNKALRSCLTNLFWSHVLECSLRCNRHEVWSLNSSEAKFETAYASMAVLCSYSKSHILQSSSSLFKI